jgi:tetratricopeptide (TPR) repeat protein
MAVTLPLILISIDYFFLSQQNPKKVLKNLLRFHMGFFIVLGAYLLMRSYVLDWFFVKGGFSQGISFFDGTHHFWRLFTVIKILALYIRLLFLPYGLKAWYFFSAANSLFEPMVLAGLILLSLLIFIFFENLKKNPVLSFSILWFFITILPVSNIFPQQNIFAERYMYIPLAGFCIAMGFLFHWLLNKNIKTNFLNWKKSLCVLFFLLIVAFGRVTYERNKVWHDDLTLWSDVAKVSPRDQISHANLAGAYYGNGLLDEAINELKNITQTSDSSKYSILTLAGDIYLKKGLIDEAIKAYQLAIDIFPDVADAYHSLAIAYGLKGQYQKALEAGLVALKNNPYLDMARYNVAISYVKLGLISEAINAFEEYLNTSMDNVRAHVDVGHLYYQKGNYQKAKEHWLLALKISKDYQPAKDALKLLEK